VSRTGASSARTRAARSYSVRVGGVAGTAQAIGLDEDDDRDAVMTAFGACTPFGHSLWKGHRFVGWFEPGDDRIRGEWLLEEAAELARDMGLTRQ
jgi:hypothetical protein